MQIMNVAGGVPAKSKSFVCVCLGRHRESPRNDGDERRITVATSCTTRNVERSKRRRRDGGIYLFKDLAFRVFQQWMS